MATPSRIGVLGSGTMGVGIAQVAASAGHSVVLVDADTAALARARSQLDKNVRALIDKGRLSQEAGSALTARVTTTTDIASYGDCSCVIEAITEQLDAKRAAFLQLEHVVAADCILATNTSSLSIAAIAADCAHPQRVIGAHFFNPAHLLPLVEVVPGLGTDATVVAATRALVESCGKIVVIAKDTPGFIVNRIARPFYGEALRLLEEGVADSATIDWAMRDLGGFRMGPFELMDLIGNDINYQVTETIFAAFYFDPRFKPSVIQKRLVEAKRFGRKTGSGFYDYRNEAAKPSPRQDQALGQTILQRVLCMLINEAADAVHCGIASVADIELAMTKGVSYPKGLLQWADELGIANVVEHLAALQSEYGEDRYRPHVL
ncbi:MAG: 3-hydroxyacyl-CoA dehydrogenase NAD-binding domain-containing protein, partial [Planctomycetota bacterium]